MDRRNFLQSAAALAAAIATPAAARRDEFPWHLFCDDVPYLYNLTTPFAQSDFTFATDGAIMVRLPRTARLFRAARQQNRPDALAIWRQHTEGNDSQQWRPLAGETIAEGLEFGHCHRCHGRGYLGADRPNCRRCGGAGWVDSHDNCPRCQGGGIEPRSAETCPRCHGRPFGGNRGTAIYLEDDRWLCGGMAQRLLEVDRSVEYRVNDYFAPPQQCPVEFCFNGGAALCMPLVDPSTMRRLKPGT